MAMDSRYGAPVIRDCRSVGMTSSKETKNGELIFFKYLI
jgi:hypothetical protein